MEAINLSVEAAALLRRRLARERIEITEETRPFYRELVEAGMMIPLHTATGGNESFYRLTEAACSWNASTASSPSIRLPSPEELASLRV